MTTAREIMTSGVDYVESDSTVADAVAKLAGDDIGALPLSDADAAARGPAARSR